MALYIFEGTRPTISHLAYVHPMAVLIGAVDIANGCYIGPGAVLRGDFGRIFMESDANVQDNCVVHGAIDSETIIRRRSHVGHGAIVHGCVIGEDVLVGMNAVVMDGSEIGSKSIIGSCSMVKANFTCEPLSLLLGSPARVVKTLSEHEVVRKRQSTQRYIELAKRSLSGLESC